MIGSDCVLAGLQVSMTIFSLSSEEFVFGVDLDTKPYPEHFLKDSLSLLKFVL